MGTFYRQPFRSPLIMANFASPLIYIFFALIVFANHASKPIDEIRNYEGSTISIDTLDNYLKSKTQTITFFLVASTLALVYWAWTLIPSRLEYHPLTGVTSNYDDIKEIMNSTDIEFLRQQAIGLKFDKEAIERDSDTITAMNLLGITVVLTFTTLILLFLEIAARGRTYRHQRP